VKCIDSNARATVRERREMPEIAGGSLRMTMSLIGCPAHLTGTPSGS
jgi:hypothetical protein